MCEWMWKGFRVGGWQMTSKLGEGGICSKNDIIRTMHSLWSSNIFCLDRSVMDKNVVRTPRVATGATGEVSQCIDSVPQKRSW